MKKAGLIAICCSGLMAMNCLAEKTRTIIFNEDRDQHYMTTKVYELKNVDAHDIAPYIDGAIKRYDPQSNIKSLDYSKGGTKFIVISTGNDMIPYVDDMVKKLDHPSLKKDAAGSIVDGDGIYRFTYCSKFRGTTNMKEVIEQTFTGGLGAGAAYYDEPTNMFYWKSSKSEGELYKKFLTAVDRPLPQMRIYLNFYLVNDNDFRELGIDYLSWKNGPGMNLFGAGFDYTNLDNVTNFSNLSSLVAEGPGGAATGLGGIFVAPQIDATFLRMLAQKGVAKMAVSASLSLVNDFGADSDPGVNNYDGAKYRFKFTPEYQNVQKDDDQKMSVEVLDSSDIWFYVRMPIICFNGDKAEKAVTLMCGWQMQVDEPVEENNQGVASVNTNSMYSTLTIADGAEKLIATYDKDVYTYQYNGVPFVGEIPVLKYLLGSESKVKSKSKVFVTMKAEAISPDAAMPDWAGKVIAADTLANADKK